MKKVKITKSTDDSRATAVPVSVADRGNFVRSLAKPFGSKMAMKKRKGISQLREHRTTEPPLAPLKHHPKRNLSQHDHETSKGLAIQPPEECDFSSPIDNNNAIEQPQQNNDNDEEQQHPASLEEPQDAQVHQVSQSQIFTVNNAFRVLTRRERLQQDLRNAPVVEGRIRAPSNKRQQQQQEEEYDSTRKNIIILIALFLFLIIVAVAVAVPLALVTRKRQGNNDGSDNSTSSLGSNLKNTTLESTKMPSSSPSTSLIPSFAPSTEAPTSTAFADVVALLGLEDNPSMSQDLLDQDYVVQSIQWMAHVDQITPQWLQLLSSNRTVGGSDSATIFRDAALQRFALVSFFYATGGETSWLDPLGFLNPSTHECEWRAFGRDQVFPGGATIGCVNSRIAGIALNNNNLGGFIPETITLLAPRLEWLELQSNDIGGTIPSVLSKLTFLGTLAFPNNTLSGSIPSEITTLENLGAVILQLNELTGSIPESIGALSNLAFINLATNMLTGSIPSSMQSMSNLELLDLNFNMLTSSLPTELNRLSNLRIYSLTFNLLSGTLPFQAGANPSLSFFGCVQNGLGGNISGLSHLFNLGGLSFIGNRFTGSIPAEFCNLPLTLLNGANNMLSGSLPNCLGLGASSFLRSLSLFNNSLEGTIPTTLPLSLEVLSLSNNNLSGSIPEGPFPSLTRFDLSNNTNFSGMMIPTEIGQMKNLDSLSLFGCNLVGPIPSEVGLLTRLRRFNLVINNLSGTIPTELGNLQNINAIGLANNALTGTIPSELGRLSFLEFLALNLNNLSGSLPSSFVDLPRRGLSFLSLQGNNLMGSAKSFCRNRFIATFNADCQELTNCTCCTSCCDSRQDATGTCLQFQDDERNFE